MKSFKLENFRRRAANDENLAAPTMRMITQISYNCSSERSMFTMTPPQINALTGLKDKRTIYGHISTLRSQNYIELLGRDGTPGRHYYRLKIIGEKPPRPEQIARELTEMFPGMSALAPMIGKAGGSKPKNYSADELAKRTKRIKAALKKRWPKKRSK